MTTTTKTRKGGLDWSVPESGSAADACAVASTMSRLLDTERGRSSHANGLNTAARHATRLHIISGKIHRIAERLCNEDLACPACKGEGSRIPGADAALNMGGKLETELRQNRIECRACVGHGNTLGRRLESLRADAREIAEHYGLTVYFQTDPRGCALYLIDPSIVPQSWAGIPGDPLERYVCQSESHNPPPLATLQARWIESNYTRGHAVTRLGR